MARGYSSTFKITSSASDFDLDRLLDERGYQRVADTSVQTADLSALPSSPPGRDMTVALATRLEDAWFADFNRLTATPEGLQDSERRLLEKISPPQAFGRIAVGGQTVGLGLAVAEREYVGLFDIVVERTARNQGLGRHLCLDLLQWARNECGAGTGYLAVMLDNAAALKLYANLGFREAYRYWYRHVDRRR